MGGLGWRGAAALACSAARPNGVDAQPPGLRRSPPPLTRGVARSEPGILSARTLRGSEGVIPSGRERREDTGGGVSAGWNEAACPCSSSTKIRMRHDSHPTKPPCGRHGGAYKGRWSTTTPSRWSGERGNGGENGLCWRGAADLARSAARPSGWAGTYPRSTQVATSADAGCRPLRTGDSICPHAPRLRWRYLIRREEIVGVNGGSEGSEGRGGNPGGDKQGAVPGDGAAPCGVIGGIGGRWITS